MFCETLFGLSVFCGISIVITVKLVWIMAAKESPLAGDVTRITYTPAQMYAMRRTVAALHQVMPGQMTW